MLHAMPPTPCILVFAGSLRAGSWNKKLARVAAAAAEAAGGQVTLIDLIDYQMPLYNADDETATGLPEAAWRLREQFFAHDGLLISAPEYNSSMTGVLKNTIDWLSRKPADVQEPPLAVLRNKAALLLAASPGALGGLRGLVHLRAMLQNLGVNVLPFQYALSRADTAFTAEGALVDPKGQAIVEDYTGKFVRFLSKTGPTPYD